MANPPPPYSNITGISRTVMKDNAQESITNYNGNARPGEMVVDLSNDDIYVGNVNGGLTLISTGGGSGNNAPAGPVGAIQINAGGALFGGTANLTFTNNTLITGNISPAVDNTYFLGDSTHRWANLWLGPGTIYITDSANTANIAELTVHDGILEVNGATGLQANLINGNTTLTLEHNGNITLDVNGAGNAFIVTQSGALLTSTAPTDPTLAAFEINGNISGEHLSPNNPGVMLHATGLPDTPTRIYLDAIGANVDTDNNSYPAFVGRAARGTIADPAPLTGGDIIARFGGNPYSEGGFNALTNTRIDFVAIEDQTASNRGTQIEFWNTPAGSNVINRTAVFDSAGIYLTGTELQLLDGNDNTLLTLDTTGNLVFEGTGTLSLQGGFFVSTVAAGSSDGNLVVYSGGEFKYGSQLKDYTGNIGANNITMTGILKAPQTTKASNATGTPGQICWDANYIYVCTATNTWKRSPLTGGY